MKNYDKRGPRRWHQRTASIVAMIIAIRFAIAGELAAVETQDDGHSDIRKWIDERQCVEWVSGLSDLASCLRRGFDAYSWSVENIGGARARGRLRISINEQDGRKIHAWTGSWNSLFVVYENKLVYMPSTEHRQAEVVCVDLETGRQPWRQTVGLTNTEGLAAFDHYRAKRTLGVTSWNENQYVVVSTCGSTGAWITVIDFETGKIIGERKKPIRFIDSEPDWCPCRPRDDTPPAGTVPKT